MAAQAVQDDEGICCLVVVLPRCGVDVKHCEGCWQAILTSWNL